MKVKIKKEGQKTESFKLIDSWEDVSLDTWIKLIEFKKISKSKEATETIAALSDIPKKLIKELQLSDVAIILSKVYEMQQQKSNRLKRIITINDIEYGFHPELDSISLGEFADLEQFIKNGIENSLPEMMAILYRPVKKKSKNGYIISAYDGDIRMRTEEMRLMSAEQVQSALVFFYHLGRTLLNSILLFSMEQMKEMTKQSEQNHFQASGVGSV